MLQLLCTEIQLKKKNKTKLTQKQTQHLGVKSRTVSPAGLAVKGTTPHFQFSVLKKPILHIILHLSMRRRTSVLKGHGEAQLHLRLHLANSKMLVFKAKPS